MRQNHFEIKRALENLDKSAIREQKEIVESFVKLLRYDLKRALPESEREGLEHFERAVTEYTKRAFLLEMAEQAEEFVRTQEAKERERIDKAIRDGDGD